MRVEDRLWTAAQRRTAAVGGITVSEVIRAALEAYTAACECGCGDAASPGSRYLPGHDARHVSALADQLAAGELTLERAARIVTAPQLEQVATIAASRGWRPA